MSVKYYRNILFAMLFSICSLIYVSVYNDVSSIYGNTAVSGNGSISINEGGSDMNPIIAAESTEGVSEENTDEKDNTVHMVMPSGKPIGIYVKTKGVMVIGTGEIQTLQGNNVSPCRNLIETGDYIMEINGTEVNDKEGLINAIEECRDEEIIMKVNRKGSEIDIAVTPILSSNKKYMLGLWVKDDIAGIGTLTYIDENGFGALGHSINDNDTGELFDISDGAIYETELVNIVKSDGEHPGRLEGIIDYSSSNVIGRVKNNTLYGIKGYMTKNAYENLASGEWMPIAQKEEAHLGDALILSSVSGKPEYYEIEITGVDVSDSSGNKGLEIVINDSRLLQLTSGIVQGMSGTPIIQDGKLLGAVTHVFLRDSARGYGTFVENIMSN
ncbi:MAG: SpoIVB peptidase [Lachnospiraceae bacterium]|nr:SpoIVB peptidase [Lachnospiraceae bacterium]